MITATENYNCISTLYPSSLYGQSTFFDDLVRQYKGRLSNYVFNLVKDYDLTEDICQEVYIKVWNSIKSAAYTESNKIFSFLLKIAKNLVIDHFRKEKTNIEVHTISSTNDFGYIYESNDHNAEDGLEKQQLCTQIRESFKYLSPAQKVIIEMRYFDGYSFKEIANKLDTPLNTVLSRHYSALDLLRRTALVAA